MIDYRGRVALVTGGASGIGRALAEALAARGARLVIADRDEAGAARVAEALGGAAIGCDLSDPDAPKRLLDAVCADHGLPTLICSNAGLGRNRRMLKEDFGAEAWSLFQLNLFAGLKLAQHYVTACEGAGVRGRMMLTCSENSLSVPDAVKTFGLGLYGATKHGLLIALEWLHNESVAADKPIDLHALCPGGVLTPPIAAKLPDPSAAPPGFHLITPERCAELAVAGMDAGLFYIPTHPHIADDMRVRSEGITDALRTLGLA